MKKQERTVKQQVASVRATLCTFFGIVMLVLADKHIGYAVIGVLCFYFATKYNELSNN